jgi:hypothetical protein
MQGGLQIDLKGVTVIGYAQAMERLLQFVSHK